MDSTPELPEKNPPSGVDPEVLEEILKSYKGWRFKLPSNELRPYETPLPPLENRLERLPRREYEDFDLSTLPLREFTLPPRTGEQGGNSDFQAGAGSADADDATPDTGGSQ